MPRLVRLPAGVTVRVPDNVTDEQVMEKARERGLDQPSGSGLSGSGRIGLVTQPRSFANAQDPDTRSEFSKGVSAGVDTLQGSLYGLAALVGDSVGNERLK